MSQPGHTKVGAEQLVQSIRHSRFIYENLGDELVVFDRNSNKAHLLDARSAAVFRACEHGAPLSELESLMEGPAEKRAALVRIAVLELERVGLVVTSGRDEDRLPRRSLLKTLGIAASLPVIVSIVAPTPVAAQSPTALGVPGSSCTQASDCGGCVGACDCKPVGGSGGGALKCCIADDGIFGDPCTNDNDCCCPELECSTGGGPMTCVDQTMGRAC